MWSNAMYSFIGSWLPNYFVPLIDTNSDSILDIYDVDDFPPLNMLNSTTVNESCNACPTIFDETPILRNAEVSDHPDAPLSGTAENAIMSGTAKNAKCIRVWDRWDCISVG